MCIGISYVIDAVFDAYIPVKLGIQSVRSINIFRVCHHNIEVSQSCWNVQVLGIVKKSIEIVIRMNNGCFSIRCTISLNNIFKLIQFTLTCARPRAYMWVCVSNMQFKGTWHFLSSRWDALEYVYSADIISYASDEGTRITNGNQRKWIKITLVKKSLCYM